MNRNCPAAVPAERPLTDGVVTRIVTGPHDASRQGPHRPMRYDTGRPRASQNSSTDVRQIGIAFRTAVPPISRLISRVGDSRPGPDKCRSWNARRL
jgi:hypothetical protein